MENIINELTKLKASVDSLVSDKVLQQELIAIGFSRKLLNMYYSNPEKKYKLKNKSKYYMLYEVSLVKKILELEGFDKEYNKTIARRIVGKKYAQDTIFKNTEIISNINIIIENLDINIIKRDAVKSWEQWNGRIWDFSDNEETKRIMCNYIRHNLTDYECSLYQIKGKMGKQDLYEILKDRTMDKIFELYPKLKPL